jgi:hypothetical protein
MRLGLPLQQCKNPHTLRQRVHWQRGYLVPVIEATG